MHENALAQDLVRQAVTVAKNQAGCRITALNLTVGHRPLVSKEALSFAIQAAGQGTLAEGCRVQFIEAAVDPEPGKEEGYVILESIELAEAFQCA